MDRMFCYLWHEINDKDECKFGERFVLTGQDPMQECRRRIRDSLGVRKDKFDEGTVVVDSIWDVSEWADKVGRNRKGGHMDDYIREQIGFRKGSTGEVHRLDADVMAFKVNKLLQKNNQPLLEAGLSQWQYDQAENVIEAMAQGKRTMLAELCARFGKTIWAGALAVETQSPLTIVASYVLTSFASFAKDLTSFEQFRNIEVVDSQDPNYQTIIEDALNDNRQVVVFLSMTGSSKRQDRIDYLFGIPIPRLVFIDEADFGAHTQKQSDPFVNARKENDTVILMTGTNGERALGSWTIDHYLGTTYAELIMEKAENGS